VEGWQKWGGPGVQCRAYSKAFLILHTPMASTGAQAYNGGLGRSPQQGFRGQSPRWGQGAKPPEANEVFV